MNAKFRWHYISVWSLVTNATYQLKCHITKQLLTSISVNIRIYLPSVNITFFRCPYEINNCIMYTS